MDRRERANDPQTALLAALQGWQAGLWSALPGIVQSFDAKANTVSIQPAIQALVRNSAGVADWVTLPILVDVPVVFPGGGGFSLTFPLAAGDEALIVFASRCIDSWYQSGGVQVQAELRMHDLSDGFALPGVRSLPRGLTGGASTSKATLRSDDGNMRIELAAGGVCNIVAPGGVNINGVTIDSSGNVTAPAGATIKAPTINGTTDVKFGTRSASTHVHGGVQLGPNNTGAPA